MSVFRSELGARRRRAGTALCVAVFSAAFALVPAAATAAETAPPVLRPYGGGTQYTTFETLGIGVLGRLDRLFRSERTSRGQPLRACMGRTAVVAGRLGLSRRGDVAMAPRTRDTALDDRDPLDDSSSSPLDQMWQQAVATSHTQIPT